MSIAFGRSLSAGIGYVLVLCLSGASAYGGAASDTIHPRITQVGLIVLGVVAGLWMTFSRRGNIAIHDTLTKIPPARLPAIVLAPLIQYPAYAAALSLCKSGWVVSVVDLAVEVMALVLLSRTVFRTSADGSKWGALSPVALALFGAAIVDVSAMGQKGRVGLTSIALVVASSVAAAFRIDSLRYLRDRGVDRSFAFAVNFAPAALGALLTLPFLDSGNAIGVDVVLWSMPYALLVGAPTLVYYVFLSDSLAREIPMVICAVPIGVFAIEAMTGIGSVAPSWLGALGMLIVVGAWLLNRNRERHAADRAELQSPVAVGSV